MPHWQYDLNEVKNIDMNTDYPKFKNTDHGLSLKRLTEITHNIK